MRFELGLARKFALALLVAVSASFAADVAPLHFTGIADGDQQDYWDELMKYKIFGAHSIQFVGQKIRIPDESGWFGTAAGDFNMQNSNTKHTVGGPVLIGGNMILSDGEDTISTGPVRIMGNITMPLNGWATKSELIQGDQCIEGSAVSEYLNVVKNGNVYQGSNYSNCPSTVPSIKTDLAIPGFNYDGSSVRDAISLNDGTGYIDVPKGTGTYDILMKSISLSNTSILKIRMPAGGRLTRIFLQDGMSVSAHPKIRVVYMSSDAVYDETNNKWTSGTETGVENKDYAGNLLFYTTANLTFPALKAIDSIQGTFISTKTISVSQHMTLAGQLLADTIIINSEFDGSGFRYVPFDPPWLEGDPETNSWGTLHEGKDYVDVDQALSVELSKAPNTDVSFKYCFEFKGAADASVEDPKAIYANEVDIKDNENRLICNGESVYRKAVFKAGSTTLSSPITLSVVNDDLIENEEHFTIHIFDLEGAVLSDQSRAGDFDITIEDDDDMFLSLDTAVTTKEDVVYTFSSKDFPIMTHDSVLWTGEYAIRITTMPHYADSLQIAGKIVDYQGANPVYSTILDGEFKIGDWLTGWRMIYNPPKDSFGVHFDSLEYRVVRSGTMSEQTYKMYINVLPVNDAPVASPVTFTVAENCATLLECAASGSFEGSVTDIDDEHFTFEFDPSDERTTDVAKLYTLDSKYGKISANIDVTHDYESADSVKSVRVIVKDSSKSTGNYEDALADTIEITIRMLDVNEKPVVEAQSFDIDENSAEGTVVGTVKASDPDRSSVPFGQLTYSIPANADDDATNNVPFAIDPATGVITVTNSDTLDFEKTPVFTFDVIVADKGDPSMSDTAVVTINLKDLNEPPAFVDDGKSQYVVDEHSKNLFRVDSIAFVDQDNADATVADFIPTLTDKNKVDGKISAEDLFDVEVVKDAVKDSFYVVVFVKDSAKLNYEELVTKAKEELLYNVTITLKDRAGADGCNTISVDKAIKVNDINEAPSAEDATFTPDEDIKTGEEVGQVIASDPDTKNADFGTLTYTIPVNEDADAANDVPFTVNASTGVITVANDSLLDRESNPVYEFDVKVSDGTYDATARVTITLQNVNETPEIACKTGDEECNGPFSIEEYVVNGGKDAVVTIHEFVVVDPDTADFGGLTVALTDANGSGADTLFEASLKDVMNGSATVVLAVKDSLKLDYEKINESYTVVLTVTDVAGAQDTIIRTIKVVDVNEVPVVADVNEEIEENLPVGTVVATMSTTEPDTKTEAFRHLEYSIITKNVPFVMDTNMVKVSNTTALNYEVTTMFTFQVEVKNCLKNAETGKFTESCLADTANVVMNLKDVEEPPEIIPDPDDETCEGDDCHKCDATIADCDHPGDVPDTTCTENCGYVVTKNGHDTLYVNVRENTASGTKILTYAVDDEDVGDLATMNVRFESVNHSGADSLFNITESLSSENTFTLSVADKEKLDYEKVNELHVLRIIVEDDGGKADSIIRVVKVVDVNEKPTLADASFTVDENSEKGAEVGLLVATDPDVIHPKAFGTLTYTILDANIPFAMDSNKVVVNGTLNFEKKSSYEFSVIVSDGELSDTAKVNITVTNVNEPPFIVCLDGDKTCAGPFDVEENTATGTEIHTFAVQDDDVNPEYHLNTASISDMNGTDAADLFDIKFNADSTQVTVFVKDQEKLDYEKVQSSYSVKIKVSDAMDVADSIIRVINVIDVNEEPSIADTTFTIAENSANATVVGKMRSSDPDIKNNIFSKLTYEVVGDVPFAMDSNKVVVSDVSRLNYEVVKVFTFQVRVTDGGNLTDIADVTVTLSDADENPEIVPDPDDETCEGDDCHKCDATIADCDHKEVTPDPTCTENCGYVVKKNGRDTIYVNVRENSATDTKILKYYVTDEDVGDLNSMTVSFSDDNKSGSDSLFTITPNLLTDEKGFYFELSVADGDKLDYETTNHVHKITITATDDAGLTDTVVRVINIVDVNEPPFIVKADFDLDEHNKVNTVVGTIEWGDDRDKDGVSNPAFRENRVVLVDGATDVFDVDSMGVITVKKTLNYETDDSVYTLVVDVQDKNDPTLKSTETITIHLQDVLETPVITSTEFSIPENPADRAVVGTLTSEDPDDLENEETRTYALVSKSDYVKVTEDGKIVVINKDKFDYEKVQSFTILVEVTDPQGVSSDTTVTIKITDVNEAPSLDDKTIKVAEDTEPDTEIDTLKATDPDTKNKEFRDLTYTMIDGDSTMFKVDPKTGVVTLIDSLDFERDSVYVLTVEVNDGEFADTAKVTVKVGNVVERSEVVIEKVDDGDSVWVRPDSVFTNRPEVTICWTEDGKNYCQDTTLTEGIHTIIKTYKDPTKDYAGADTVIIQLSTTAPIVIVSAKADTLDEGSIYTVDEMVAEGDTSIYVNDSKNDIKVTVKDPVNNKDSSFTVKLDLETVDVSKSDLSSIATVVEKGKLVLDESPSTTVTRTPVNGTEVKVSYTEEVNGKTVTVTYYTDNDGDVVKTAVIDEKGNVDSIEVITVSYETTIGGREVTVSYQADAITGQVLNVASDGTLTYDDKIVVETTPTGKPVEGDTTAKTTTEVSVGSYKVTYEYEDENHNTVVVTYTIDEKGNIVKNGDGDIGYTVSYTYENKFGNSATQSVFIVLDQKGPMVKIESPTNMEKIYANSVTVVWTVNGVVQDTLTVQGLEKGYQKIKRVYRDKAGNEGVDSIFVMVKDAKDIDMRIVEPVVEMNKDKVEEYYESNPPEEGETFAVSIGNATTGKEVEVLTGGSYGQKDGSLGEPYPGEESGSHLGPTIAMEIRLPVVNNVGGLATLDDIVGSDGLVSLDGVDAKNSEKVTLEEYVADYCDADFEYGSDLSRVNLYKTRMHARVWIYTTLGNFVDYHSFKVDLNDPDYTDEAGVLNMYFEQKPDKDGEIHTDDGHVLATGAYLYKVETDIRATLRCTLPPVKAVDTNTAKKKGDVIKKSDEMLKSFGYKRPKD